MKKMLYIIMIILLILFFIGLLSDTNNPSRIGKETISKEIKKQEQKNQMEQQRKTATKNLEDEQQEQVKRLAYITRKEFLEEFNAEEDKVADIMLKDGILYLGLLDDDFNRRGFAEYTCVTLLERNNDTIFGNDANILIVIKDVQSGKEIGRTFCKNPYS